MIFQNLKRRVTMLNEQFKIFKSGTDIRGVASEGVEGQSVNLTDEMVYKMADGFVLWLSKKLSKKCCCLIWRLFHDLRAVPFVRRADDGLDGQAFSLFYPIIRQIYKQ